MKEYLKNKLRTVLLVGAAVSITASCTEEEAPTLSETSTTLEVTDAYLQVNTPVVAFQSGIEDYEVAFNVINGSNTLVKVDVWNTFTDAASGTGLTSDPILLTSYDVTVPSNTREQFESVFTYTDLKSGITIGGNALPESDFDLKVGAIWNLNFVGYDNSGKEYPLAGAINIAVLSPFAGLYRVTESAYYRIGVGPNADWTGELRFIGSVDEFTFSYNDFWGNFTSTGGVHVFSLSEDYATTLDYSLTVLDDPSQLHFVGDHMLTCQEDGSSFTSVPCTGSNLLVPDLVDGKHEIRLTYGYYTASGDENEGAREFYEFMEKVVN